jgi:hypothetical protein
MFELLEAAKVRLEHLKGPVQPKLERRCKQLSNLKPANQERNRRLIELRFSEPDEQTVKDLNLFVGRLIDYESCCAAAQKVVRRLYNQAGGFFDSRSVGVEHSVAIGG